MLIPGISGHSMTDDKNTETLLSLFCYTMQFIAILPLGTILFPDQYHWLWNREADDGASGEKT
jgi:hypothetical protein